MATNAMDSHSNVSPVITDVELCRRHPRLCRSSAEQTEELNTFRSSLSAGHEIYPVCSTAIGVSSSAISAECDPIIPQPDNNAFPEKCYS